MNKEEFIGKLEMVYVGDRNAFNEIVEDNQKLKNEIIYAKTEIDRLNNIIEELEKHLNQEIIEWQDASDLWTKAQVQEDKIVLNKLKKLKENNK